MDREDERIRPTLEKIMKDHGITTRDELLAKIKAQMTPEEAAEFQKIIDDYAELTGNLDTAVTISLYVGLATTAVNVGFRVAHVITSGLGGVAIRVTISALAKVFSAGFDAAAPLLNLANKILRNTMNALKPWASAPANIGKWSGYALKATKILGAVTILLDVLLIVIAAIVGDQQRTKLREAINELLPRRALTKFWELQAGESGSTNKLVIDYIQDLEDEADDPEYLEKRAKKIATAITNGLQDVTIDEAIANMRIRDQQRPIPTWTDEDLSDEEIKRIVQQEIDPALRS